MKKMAIVSGASSGVGLAISRRLVELDWDVVGVARDKEKLAVAERLLSSDFRGYSVSLERGESVAEFFEVIKGYYGEVALVVNAAAVFKMKPYSECSIQDIDRLIDINLKGSMYLTLNALQWMKETGGGGRIVNIGSVAGLNGIENQAIYCGSKFGMRGFAEALNQEIIGDGISITTISPGGINTPLWNNNNIYPGNVGDLLKPEDVAKAVEFIVGQNPRVIIKEITMFPSNEWH